MTETTPFFQSWGFWLCLGLFIGTMFGFFVAALCASSGQASRDEEWVDLHHRAEEEKRGNLKESFQRGDAVYLDEEGRLVVHKKAGQTIEKFAEEAGLRIKFIPITKGNPDRE